MKQLVLIAVATSFVAVGCKGKDKDKDKGSGNSGTSGKTVDGPATPVTDSKVVLLHGNNPPTLELPAYEFVGVDQEIGFGLEVVDEESDRFIIELLEKPASATFDHPTLTVVWKPTKADMPLGQFRVKITEKRRDGGGTRSFIHDFSIGVTAQKQPLPKAQPLGAAVETLITIHDEERLAQVNEQWPIDVLLEKAARSTLADLNGTKKVDAVVADRKALYESFLHQLAKANHNDSVDPASPKFDAKVWADPKDWKIIALRPRLDKKWHELRIVYKAKAHAATYAMFKFRPYGATSVPEDTGRLENNKQVAELVLDAFFTEAGTLDPTLMTDKKAHAAKVAEFMNAIVNFDSKDKPWPTATFLGLPMESRLGGGSERDAKGAYVSGDGWGWHVMKAKPKDGKLVFKNIPIKGFTTSVKPAEDNKSWKMACSKKFASGDFAALCRKTGHVDLPATGDGYSPVELSQVNNQKLVSSLVDAANMHHEYKAAMESELDLHDPRRDLFEEKGMTCHQCHVRKFGVRDMHDRAAYDPSAGIPKALNKKQNTSYFVLTPTERWQPYMIDFQHKQECKIKQAIEDATGKKTSLTCPLMPGN